MKNKITEYRETLNQKNSLRHKIKQKKHTLSKLSQIPECMDEYFTLKKEIETLEKEYQNLQ